MHSFKIKYFLYGILISISLNFIITQASSNDGEFGVYFERITGICNADEVITGYSGDSLNFWEKKCTPFKEIVGNIFWGSVPANSTVIGFSSTGEILYAPNHWKENAGNISYTGTNVGIGTNFPTSKLDIVGGNVTVRNISGNIAIWNYDATKDTSISNGISFFNAGNVWFGKTNPTVAVDVLGDMKVSNTTIVPKIILNGTELKAPPSCFGANQALQWDGANWSCGTLPTIASCNTATANTCTKWTPSGYNAGSCGWNATWICNGANGWASVNCSKTNAPCPINGVCGSANGTSTVSYPTANWCANGTKVDVDTTGGDGTYNWRCDGSGGGSNASCSANKTSSLPLWKYSIVWTYNFMGIWVLNALYMDPSWKMHRFLSFSPSTDWDFMSSSAIFDCVADPSSCDITNTDIYVTYTDTVQYGVNYSNWCSGLPNGSVVNACTMSVPYCWNDGNWHYWTMSNVECYSVTLWLAPYPSYGVQVSDKFNRKIWMYTNYSIPSWYYIP